MYEVKDRIFTKKFIDILTYAIEQDYIDIAPIPYRNNVII